MDWRVPAGLGERQKFHMSPLERLMMLAVFTAFYVIVGLVHSSGKFEMRDVGELVVWEPLGLVAVLASNLRIGYRALGGATALLVSMAAVYALDGSIGLGFGTIGPWILVASGLAVLAPYADPPGREGLSGLKGWKRGVGVFAYGIAGLLTYIFTTGCAYVIGHSLFYFVTGTDGAYREGVPARAASDVISTAAFYAILAWGRHVESRRGERLWVVMKALVWVGIPLALAICCAAFGSATKATTAAKWTLALLGGITGMHVARGLSSRFPGRLALDRSAAELRL